MYRLNAYLGFESFEKPTIYYFVYYFSKKQGIQNRIHKLGLRVDNVTM